MTDPKSYNYCGNEAAIQVRPGDNIRLLFHKAQHPRGTYLALDENACDSSCLCVERQNQKASLALLGTTLRRAPGAGSFPLNSRHTAQSPPEVWLLFVCYLVLSRLWSSEQIANSSLGRENILQRGIIQILSYLTHQATTSCQNRLWWAGVDSVQIFKSVRLLPRERKSPLKWYHIVIIVTWHSLCLLLGWELLKDEGYSCFPFSRAWYGIWHEPGISLKYWRSLKYAPGIETSNCRLFPCMQMCPTFLLSWT